MQHPQSQQIKACPSIPAALENLQTIDMALDDTVVPFEHESCLNSFLILTEFVDTGTQFGNATVKSGSQPLIQFFSSAATSPVSQLLEQGSDAMNVRMKLADLMKDTSFLLPEIFSRTQHQPDSAMGGHFQSRRGLADRDPLLLHGTKPSDKSLHGHP
jgi:hypothetical protein